jgi:hypothetical protein
MQNPMTHCGDRKKPKRESDLNLLPTGETPSWIWENFPRLVDPFDFILFIYLFIIHMCIQCLGHFSPLPPPPPLPPTPPLPLPPPPRFRQKLFCPYL